MATIIEDISNTAKLIAEEIILERNFKPLNLDAEWDSWKDMSAVYVIKEKNHRLCNGQVFYVGKSIRLGSRFSDHLKGDSNLKKKLETPLDCKDKRLIKHHDGTTEMILSYKEIENYLQNDCLFSIVEKDISDYDLLNLVEALLIKYYRENGSPLLNEYKKK